MLLFNIFLAFFECHIQLLPHDWKTKYLFNLTNEKQECINELKDTISSKKELYLKENEKLSLEEKLLMEDSEFELDIKRHENRRARIKAETELRKLKKFFLCAFNIYKFILINYRLLFKLFSFKYILLT